MIFTKVSLVFVTWTVNDALVAPIAVSAKVTAGGSMERVEVGATPVPVSVKLWVPAGVLSVKVAVPVLTPVVVGVNVTLALQPCPGLNVVTQPLSKKSPVAEDPEMITGTFPVLVMVTSCPTLVVPTTCGLNTSPAEESVSAGAPAKPVPVKLTELLGETLLLEINNEPENVPASVGRNAMLIVQLVLDASEAGQLFD